MPTARSTSMARPTPMKSSSGEATDPNVASTAKCSATNRESPSRTASRLRASQATQNSPTWACRAELVHGEHRERVADAAGLACRDRVPGPRVGEVLLGRVAVPAGVEDVRLGEVLGDPVRHPWRRPDHGPGGDDVPADLDVLL